MCNLQSLPQCGCMAAIKILFAKNYRYFWLSEAISELPNWGSMFQTHLAAACLQPHNFDHAHHLCYGSDITGRHLYTFESIDTLDRYQCKGALVTVNMTLFRIRHHQFLKTDIKDMVKLDHALLLNGSVYSHFVYSRFVYYCFFSYRVSK